MVRETYLFSVKNEPMKFELFLHPNCQCAYTISNSTHIRIRKQSRSMTHNQWLPVIHNKFGNFHISIFLSLIVICIIIASIIIDIHNIWYYSIEDSSIYHDQIHKTISLNNRKASLEWYLLDNYYCGDILYWLIDTNTFLEAISIKQII